MPPHTPPPKIPRPLSPQELPEKYRSAERKVRMIIVALPIAIVTSWFLYNRLVNGEEQKKFIVSKKTGPAAVVAEEKNENR
ncbi:hypothetical protein RUND412_009060 [Rhizina undulata]